MTCGHALTTQKVLLSGSGCCPLRRRARGRVPSRHFPILVRFGVVPEVPVAPKEAVARHGTVVTHPAAPLAEHDRARRVRHLSPAVTAASKAGESGKHACGRYDLPRDRRQVASNEPFGHPPNASGRGENLNRQWPISDRAGVHRRTPGCAHSLVFGRLENRGSACCKLAYPPEGAASAYSSPDGKLSARRLILDVAVGKAKKQNRRRRNSMSVPANEELREFPFIDALDVDDLLLDPSDHPEHAVPTKRGTRRRP